MELQTAQDRYRASPKYLATRRARQVTPHARALQSAADKRFRQNHLIELREKQRTEAAARRSVDREPSRKAARDSNTRHPMRVIFRSARWRANKYGIEFNITLDDLTPLMVKLCPAFKTPLEYGAQKGKGYNPNAASLDRINNDRGYVHGNIIIISRRANSIKNDGTAAEHRMIAEWMEKIGGDIGFG